MKKDIKRLFLKCFYGIEVSNQENRDRWIEAVIANEI